jgi:hypothetical protein
LVGGLASCPELIDADANFRLTHQEGAALLCGSGRPRPGGGQVFGRCMYRLRSRHGFVEVAARADR